MTPSIDPGSEMLAWVLGATNVQWTAKLWNALAALVLEIGATIGYKIALSPWETEETRKRIEKDNRLAIAPPREKINLPAPTGSLAKVIDQIKNSGGNLTVAKAALEKRLEGDMPLEGWLMGWRHLGYIDIDYDDDGRIILSVPEYAEF
jgi:hypothetical protein